MYKLLRLGRGVLGLPREIGLHHFMLAKHRPELGRFLAVVVFRGGHTSEWSFPDRRLATKWFERKLAGPFKDKIERVELYSHTQQKRLIWAKSLP